VGAPSFRPPAAFVHGDGAVVVVPARAAAWLERFADLRALRIRHRGADPEVDAVLVALGVAAAAWREQHTGTANGTTVADVAEPAPSSSVTTAEAGQLLGIGPRAVRRAIAEGRLRAERHGDVWRIRREDVEHFRAARAA
jgi:excisionase family DNA binding protein